MENVMLNSIQTQIKIVDFGLSNIWTPGAMLRTHCGSPEYAAPELFVTGKKYGPEVDLWSLGIILYGMAVGQLPFVCSKSDNKSLSSSERRKKLVLLINRGLAGNQKRALAPFSSDFRRLVNTLLDADAAKRCSVKELCAHPWITEKGTKYVRTNPLKRLDKQMQAKIISELSILTDVDPETVVDMIKNEPFDNIAGMYHILSHRHRLNQLNGDGVTKNLGTGYISVTSDISVKQSQRVRPYSSHPDNHTVDKELKKCQKLTELPLSKIPDYRQIKSPTLRRKAYSAALDKKSNSNYNNKMKSNKNEDIRENSNDINLKCTKKETTKSKIPIIRQTQSANVKRKPENIEQDFKKINSCNDHPKMYKIVKSRDSKTIKITMAEYGRYCSQKINPSVNIEQNGTNILYGDVVNQNKTCSRLKSSNPQNFNKGESFISQFEKVKKSLIYNPCNNFKWLKK